MIRLSLILLALATVARAGNDKGNGGIVLVCRDGKQVIRTELLDYWEWSMSKVFRSLGPVTDPIEKKIERTLDRVERVDPTRAQLYRAYASHFFAEANCVHGVKLPGTDDYGYVPKPSDCAFEQAAVQREPFFLQDKRYWIDADLWAKLDNDSKAGLVLHEVVYRQALARGHQNSRISRYVTALITSEDVEKMSPALFQSEMVRFGLADSGGLPATPGPKPRIEVPPDFCR